MDDPEFTQYVSEHGGWEGIVAARLDKPEHHAWEGKTIAQIAEIRGQDPASTCFDLIHGEGIFIHGIHHTLREQDVQDVMQVPWISIGSDGSALNLKSPRHAAPAQLRHQRAGAGPVCARRKGPDPA